MARWTIARWMAATAVLGFNIALVRAFVLEEMTGRHLGLLGSAFLIAFPLQFGLWRYLSTQGGSRRFWLGFEVAGLAATLALIALAELDLGNVAWEWYTGVASELCYFCLPSRVDVWLTNEHFEWFLALAQFGLEFPSALLGGLIAALCYRAERPRDQADSPASQPMLQAPWKL